MYQQGDGMAIVTPSEGNIPLKDVDMGTVFKLSREDAIVYLESFTQI
jgi:hypothetical protein